MQKERKVYPQKIALAILARDCENNLPKNIKRINNLSKRFTACSIVVIENDSKDNTKNILSDWANINSSVTIISMDGVFQNAQTQGQSVSRIERMCFYRNKYLEYLREQNKDFDYVIIIDADIDYFSVEGIIKAMYEKKDWDALFANGRFYTNVFDIPILGKYYDNFAYVPYKSFSYDLDDWEMKCNNDYISFILHFKKYIKCKSAFGGVGIYKYAKVKNLIYETKPNNMSTQNKVLCEHVVFNQKINDSKFYIAKDIKVLYQKQNFFIFLKSVMNIQKLQVFFYKVFRKKHVF